MADNERAEDAEMGTLSIKTYVREDKVVLDFGKAIELVAMDLAVAKLMIQSLQKQVDYIESPSHACN